MIPKIVHVSWKTKDIINSESPIVQQGLLNMIKLNPDWNIDLSDNNDIEEYLKDEMGVDYKYVQDEHIVAKSDVWRLLKLFKDGGVYTDIDRLCNVPFADVLTDEIKCVLPTGRDYDFCQDFMMSEPGNPIFREAYIMRLNLRKQGVNNIYQMGPQNYMKAVSHVLTGEVIDTNPGLETMNRLRAVIDEIPFMATYREEPLQDTFIYNGPERSDYWEQEKRNLYQEFNMTHWTNEW